MKKAMETKSADKIQDAIKTFSKEIPTIRKANGKVVDGLVNRRAIEKKLFDEEK